MDTFSHLLTKVDDESLRKIMRREGIDIVINELAACGFDNTSPLVQRVLEIAKQMRY